MRYRAALGSMLLAGTVVAATGCASVKGKTPYPPDWTSIKTDPTGDGCPDVTGTYQDSSDSAFPAAAENRRLSDFFQLLANGSGITSPRESKHKWAVPDRPDSISFAQTPELLKVTFHEATGGSTELVFRRYHFSMAEKRFDDLFTCYTDGEPRLRFMAEPDAGRATAIPSLYVAVSSSMPFILKAADGSLVVQWRTETLALSAAVIGSGMRFNSVWYRYPMASPVNSIQP